mmetsp:Transcript_26552/g.26213  ORF Transcript_26552/g.26213 Transcript_26552/m.26213 type:complete len:106 (+) Transcript_26552:377-694(+)
MLGFFSKALAMATLCFCPPDSKDPLTPTSVSNLFSKSSIKAASASLAAFSISSSVASILPILIFSLIDVLNKIGSWLTKPINSLKAEISYCVISTPSINTVPFSG